MSARAEIPTRLIRYPSQYYPAKDRDTLAIAALLSALLHLALLKCLIVHLQAPAANPPLRETEIALVSPSAIEEVEPLSSSGRRLPDACQRAANPSSLASCRRAARTAQRRVDSISRHPVVAGIGRTAQLEGRRVAQASRAANAPAAIVRFRGDPPDQSAI